MMQCAASVGTYLRKNDDMSGQVLVRDWNREILPVRKSRRPVLKRSQAREKRSLQAKERRP